MNFFIFNATDDNQVVPWTVSPQIWIFFLATGVITTLGLFIWFRSLDYKWKKFGIMFTRNSKRVPVVVNELEKKTSKQTIS
jgi:hypothetical protein